MSQVEAIYQGGVFKPEGEVNLRENQRVRLNIEPIAPADVTAWLESARKLRQQILARRGGEPFPDSTPDVAEDRLRDI